MNCMKKNYFVISLIVVLFIATQTTKAQFISDFEDLTLSSESFWNGSDGAGKFVSGSVQFLNSYNSAWGSWSGFSYSNVTDNTTIGYTNQYSAVPGKGVLNSKNYAVGFGADTILLANPANVDGIYVTNSTYAYYEMLNGSSFSKKFSTNDFFKLTIKGFDANKALVNTVDFYLADFRFTDASKNYILNTWQWVDLSSFVNVSYITLGRTSSDVGQWGMNTPDYSCIDNLKIKEYTALNNTIYAPFKVYANSINSTINISSDESIHNVRVYSLSGNLIFENELNQKSVTISIPNTYKGMFVVKITSNTHDESRKVIL